MSTSTKPKPAAHYSESLFESGIGTVVISRFKANGDAEMGVFMVDVYCLGVKNGLFTKCASDEYEEYLDRFFQGPGGDRIEISPPCARKLVEGAVSYAKRLGLAPHRDYKLAARVFGGIDASDCSTEFEYGKDGKPLYVRGPNESPAAVNRIMDTLRRRCGEDGFDFLCPIDMF